MGESAELTDEGDGDGSFGKRAEERCRYAGEVGLLPGKPENSKLGIPRSGRHRGEVDVGGDVPQARGLERVVAGLVARIGAEGARGAVGVVVIFAGEPEVDEEEESAIEEGC